MAKPKQKTTHIAVNLTPDTLELLRRAGGALEFNGTKFASTRDRDSAVLEVIIPLGFVAYQNQGKG